MICNRFRLIDVVEVLHGRAIPAPADGVDSALFGLFTTEAAARVAAKQAATCAGGGQFVTVVPCTETGALPETLMRDIETHVLNFNVKKLTTRVGETEGDFVVTVLRSLYSYDELCRAVVSGIIGNAYENPVLGELLTVCLYANLGQYFVDKPASKIVENTKALVGGVLSALQDLSPSELPHPALSLFPGIELSVSTPTVVIGDVRALAAVNATVRDNETVCAVLDVANGRPDKNQTTAVIGPELWAGRLGGLGSFSAALAYVTPQLGKMPDLVYVDDLTVGVYGQADADAQAAAKALDTFLRVVYAGCKRKFIWLIGVVATQEAVETCDAWRTFGDYVKRIYVRLNTDGTVHYACGDAQGSLKKPSESVNASRIYIEK